MTNSVQQLLLLWKSSQGYKQSTTNNIFSAKLLLAYPAKELVKSQLPRAFTCKEGGAGHLKQRLQHFPGRLSHFVRYLAYLQTVIPDFIF